MESMLAQESTRYSTIPVFKFIMSNNLSALKELVNQNKLLVNYVHKKSGDSPIILAARLKCFDILKFLIEKQADIEHRNHDLKRALHESCYSGCCLCTDYLIRKGAEIDPLKRGDWTPLMLASAQGHVDIVQLLVSHGADIRRINKDGWTSFHLCCREGDVIILEYYLGLQHDIYKKISKNGRNCLHTSCMHGKIDAVKFLLSIDETMLYEKDVCGTTPLMDAFRFGHVEIAKYLLSNYKVDILTTDKMGCMCIHLAVQNNQQKSFQYLISKHGVEISQPCNRSMLTPLHFAAKEGHLEMLNLIIEFKGDINAVDKNRRTALHLAVAGNQVNVVKRLLKIKEIDRSLKDIEDKAANEYALSSEMKEIFGFL